VRVPSGKSMKTILITGAAGFVGRNLIEGLRRKEGLTLLPFDVDSPAETLDAALRTADVIVHLAGVNRPQNVGEFETGNAGFTDELCGKLEEWGRNPKIIFSSSIQASLDNPYGESKRLAEDRLASYAKRQGADVVIFRFTNIFGKWCRPNYNSVVATFCHNVAHDLPLTISDPSRELELVHIDDVVRAIVARVEDPITDRCYIGATETAEGQCSPALCADLRMADHRLVLHQENGTPERQCSPALCADLRMADHRSVLHQENDRSQIGATSEGRQSASWYAGVSPVYRITLGALADTIRGFRESRKTLVLPEVGDRFVHALYSTYLSYLEPDEFGYVLETRNDNRGALAEFIRTREAGQIFVSRTKPGVTRGHHFHHTKTEKFLVLEGEAIIRFRQVQSCAVIEKRVSGGVWEVMDIPPGYTHSIENVGEGELVTLFWASEPFDPARPDTYGEKV
jgi:UDP-2-acetamido-2,6-beta-L-arabino-hexul-4-ose reductase